MLLAFGLHASLFLSRISVGSERLYWVVRNRLARPSQPLGTEDLIVALVPFALEAEEEGAA